MRPYRSLETAGHVDELVERLQPAELARDRARAVDLLQRFVRADTCDGRHPITLTRQLSAFGTASVKGAIWASNRSPFAITIW